MPASRSYVGNPPEFATVAELEAYFRTIYVPFGRHSEAQWRHMAETSLRRLPTGRITTHYDPAIVRQMFAHPDDYEQWHHYDRIEAPTLVLRGANSDLLLPDTAREMAVRGPQRPDRRDRRLRPCAGAEYQQADRADPGFPKRVSCNWHQRSIATGLAFAAQVPV